MRIFRVFSILLLALLLITTSIHGVQARPNQVPPPAASDNRIDTATRDNQGNRKLLNGVQTIERGWDPGLKTRRIKTVGEFGGVKSVQPFEYCPDDPGGQCLDGPHHNIVTSAGSGLSTGTRDVCEISTNGVLDKTIPITDIVPESVRGRKCPFGFAWEPGGEGWRAALWHNTVDWTVDPKLLPPNIYMGFQQTPVALGGGTPNESLPDISKAHLDVSIETRDLRLTADSSKIRYFIGATWSSGPNPDAPTYTVEVNVGGRNANPTNPSDIVPEWTTTERVVTLDKGDKCPTTRCAYLGGPQWGLPLLLNPAANYASTGRKSFAINWPSIIDALVQTGHLPQDTKNSRPATFYVGQEVLGQANSVLLIDSYRPRE